MLQLAEKETCSGSSQSNYNQFNQFNQFKCRCCLSRLGFLCLCTCQCFISADMWLQLEFSTLSCTSRNSCTMEALKLCDSPAMGLWRNWMTLPPLNPRKDILIPLVGLGLCGWSKFNKKLAHVMSRSQHKADFSLSGGCFPIFSINFYKKYQHLYFFDEY